MSKLKFIQEINSAEANLIVKQSKILLQNKSGGFNGELKSSGTIVENYIKELIRQHIPNYLRICSGYIATTDSIDDSSNLHQYDLIVVDKNVPPVYVFGISDIEIVPAESVCGIIEIKRTLNATIIKKSVDHLKKIKIILDSYDHCLKSKNKHCQSVGRGLNFSTTSPFYAIIGLQASTKSLNSKIDNEIIIPNIIEFVDLIWGINSKYLWNFVIEKDGINYLPECPARDQSKNFGAEKCNQKLANSEIYRFAIGLMRALISNTLGINLSSQKNHLYFKSEVID